MDIAVHTGTTKASGGASLVSLSFESPAKEHAFLLLQVQAEPRDAKTLEEECATIVRHALLETEGEGWHRLDGTLKELNGLFKGFLASQALDDVHAVVAFLDAGKTLHVSHAGRGEAYLVRGGTASQITEFSRGKPVHMFVHIASGALEGSDTVVLSTQRLLRTFTPAQLYQLSLRGDQLLKEITVALDAEKEMASLAVIHIAAPHRTQSDTAVAQRRPLAAASARRGKRSPSSWTLPSLAGLSAVASNGLRSLKSLRPQATRSSSGRRRESAFMPMVREWTKKMRAGFSQFLLDLKDPERKRRAHFLLLAGALIAFLLIWMVARLSTNTERSKTKTQLSALMEQINAELQTAANRRLTGDNDAANAILDRAEQQATQVINNDSGLFRSEALNLLDSIHAKREEFNNIVRISPRVVVNVASRNPDVVAEGLIGIADGEFIVYDHQNSYHVLLNSVEDGKKITDEDLIIRGSQFAHYKSQVFLTNSNSIIELIGGQPTSMKTDDPGGWVTGKDVVTYLRYVYILSSDNKIYKYERMSNRYGTSVQYNVNGDLTGAVDMAIDGNVYVLKDKGQIVKLLRGEVQPFSIHNAPDGLLKDVTHMYKVPDGNFYFLDSVRNRVIVSTDGGATGESAYVNQYVFEGDQIGKLTDLYVDPEESHLYVMDDKRLYVIDITKRQ